MPENTTTVYFAGKVEKNCYRAKLTKNSRVMSEIGRSYTDDGAEFIYNGPTALSCDHGCFHGNSGHGQLTINGGGDVSGSASFPNGETYSGDHEDRDWSIVTSRCLKQIKYSDVFCAFLDDVTAYGTLAEIGYAVALGKRVHITISRRVAESRQFNFILALPGITHIIDDNFVGPWHRKFLDYQVKEKEKADFIERISKGPNPFETPPPNLPNR